MARVHRLEHVECFPSAHLADDDAVGTHAQRVDDELADRHLAASLDVPGSPSVTLYKDIDEIEGLYVAFAGSHSFGETGVELGLSLGLGDDSHNAANYSGADGGLSDLALTVAYSVPRLPENQSLGLNVAFTALIGDVADAVETAGGDPSSAVVGITYSVKF